MRTGDGLLTFPYLLTFRTAVALCSGLMCLSICLGDDVPAGEQLYRRKCAKCHGAEGEGTAEHHPKALLGELPVMQLAKFISKSMPPDEPGTLNEEQSAQVAGFIHRTFYSTDVQTRRKSPRIELSHLTGRQHANAIADLMVSFFEAPAAVSENGLQGSYAAIGANGDGKQVLSRIDPDIKFDFGVSSPKPDEIDPAEFAVSWNGSIRAPVSGDYEFIIHSPNSFKLHVNDRRTALIDAWIKSGDTTEFRASIRLLAGRSYPIQLFFTKAGQGTKKPEPLRNKIAPASIRLSWKPPARAQEVIPPTYLSPVDTRETLIIQTQFPPDDRSTGVERGTLVNAEWEQATTDVAIEVTEFVIRHLGDYCGVVDPEPQDDEVLRNWCLKFAERAFRRPLTPEQRVLYVNRPFSGSPNLKTAVERSVLMVLKSPRFLYAELPGDSVDDDTIASRLSFTLWDSLPDGELWTAAAAGQLRTPEQIANQARRMTGDVRLESHLREFFVQWLRIENVKELRKDRELFPGFDEAVDTDLRTSLDLFLENVIDDRRLDFRRFLLADFVYVNRRLAAMYGAPVRSDDLFHKAKIDPDRRAGLLTHPYLMATFADSRTSSPIRRGVFLVRSVLGRTLQPPPEAVPPISPDLHPSLTTRERTMLQTGAQSCQACHGLINPLGFSLESFDAIGRIRDSDNQRPIDANGSYDSREGEHVRFNGARELAKFLVDSEEVQSALIEKLFYFSVKQPIRAYGRNVVSTLRHEFVRNEFDLRRLMAEIAVVAALRKAESSDVGRSQGE